MKKIKILMAAVITITAFSFHSCGPVEPLDGYVADPNNPTTTTPTTPTTPAASGVFKVDFDGKTFIANTVQTIVNSDYISISGLKSTGELVQITLPAPFNKVGTYTWKSVSASGGVMALAYNPVGGAGGFVSAETSTVNDPAYTDTAIVVISKIDAANGKMSGTFEFTGMRYKNPTSGSTEIETKKLTNGSFTDITFTKDVVVTPTKNTFTAKFDGADYTPVYINGLDASGRIAIVARRGTIENIGFSFPNTITPGTYTLESLGDYRGQYIKNSDITNGIFGGDGTVKIISFDKVNKKIVGTFSFTASSFFITEKHEITEGAFTIFY